MEQDRDGKELKMILRYADPRGKHILEVGCGDGRVTAWLAPLAEYLVAIDPDAERLETARANMRGVDFRQGSGESLDFPGESFDIVAFTFSLHHQDPVRALDEAHRVLKRGGRALVIEPSVEGEMHRFFRVFRYEDDKLAVAQAALRNCRLALESSETFSLEWVFDDNEDLYDYFFTHNRMPRDSERIEKMDRLLGNKRMNRPIILREAVLIFSLSKK